VALVQSNLERYRFRDELARVGRKKIFDNLKQPDAFAHLIAEMNPWRWSSTKWRPWPHRLQCRHQRRIRHR